MRPSKPPLPTVGDVIRYAYLWSHEHASGQEEGGKDRPAAVVALVKGNDGRDEVVVFPITSTRPTETAAGVEIPTATRTRLGLQASSCWVIVTEANVFAWPGPDIRRPEGQENGYVYGSLPHALMRSVQQAFTSWRTAKGLRAIHRSD